MLERGIGPLREHAVTSMLSYPAPLWHMNFRLSGSSSMSSSSKFPVIYDSQKENPCSQSFLSENYISLIIERTLFESLLR